MIKMRAFKPAGRLYFLLSVLFLIMTNCDSNPYFIPVKYIDGVPTTGVAKKPLTLTGTVNPGSANNNVIVWHIVNAGGTGAVLNGNILTTETEGSVLIKAKIANGSAEGRDYTQDFKIVFKATDGNPGSEGGDEVPVAGVTLDQTSLNLKVDTKATLTAIVEPANATNKNVTWNSSDTTIAAVSAGGVVTAVSVGTAIITVKTTDGNKTATCSVTVQDDNVDVTGVTLNKTSLSLIVGAAETLTATVAPNGATNKNVAWSSSNSDVATVSNGTVTAVSPGTATITVTTQDGGKTATCTVTSISIEMVSISAGTFTMGSPNGQGIGTDEYPVHNVTLTKNFYMGKYQVTQEQYQAVMGTNPSNFKTSVNGETGTPGKLPVETVSWYDALVFCNKLSIMVGLTPAYSISSKTDPKDWGTVPTSSNTTWNNVQIVSNSTGYRLPTEAQWEYACRAGTTTAYNTGPTISDDTGWYTANSVNKTHRVGLKQANTWGLYDMHGNVLEWCWDWYYIYSDTSQSDPTGASSGSKRTLRGGRYNDPANNLRSTFRNNVSPDSAGSTAGFRIVRPQ